MCIIRLNLLTIFWSVLRDCIKNKINESYRYIYIGNNEERIVQQFFYLESNRCGQINSVVLKEVSKFQLINDKMFLADELHIWLVFFLIH